jgi:archaeosine-15-forming tRNA-guanine transglycosylase
VRNYLTTYFLNNKKKINKMFVKINSATATTNNIYANNNQDRVAMVTSLTVASNTDKSFTVAYEGGDVIAQVTPTVGTSRVIAVNSAIANTNKGKDIVVTLSQALTGNEEIGLVLDVSSITAPNPVS